ncbi:SMP-30/gluconolactonase/LRE family protein [Acetobacter sp.]|uniref:SMP-30/gluconolactonase/LRE family protein n=1 Tax=Acetobacter sp. TaxID=440 RepID=UPI0025BFACF5|nr:SMP-30/gluconolactonase/LRE family protein [Acetobacter sp.]MCH4091643.1 SMP-30/gluconolactonase/LRE family protein [Acetobacter sp.]MCI1300939.1 SMP-30/gluconolactonase/LRE family protein [Acetobacter sp.]MCI1316184.1 SMP-30/gluconolactonase/LRE family protein [Acetobacter sp.]
MTTYIPVDRVFQAAETNINEAVSVWSLQARLGEGPVWSETESAFYFVDILNCALHRYRLSDGMRSSWHVQRRPTFLVPTHDGALICGMEDGLYLFDPETGRIHPFLPVEQNYSRTRLNDGHVDRSGRLWFGTMDDEEELPIGSLYSMDGGDTALRRHHSGYTVSNGPVMSPDGRTLYHCDSAQGVIYAFDVTLNGALAGQRIFAEISNGAPDGLAMDSGGTLWVGIWGGHRLERFTSAGKRLAPIPVPAANVTKAAFGGDDLRTVFITTACKGLSAAELEAEPLNGAVFCLRTETPGMPQGLMMLPG